ncbi:Na(+)/citrate cotransporter-like [Diadema setosum]|uniref:Na(+)/citrate cotransporter-like n=1 Tax=Diadema setosum TaxID=31175 RepID=UPI003B3A3D16
MAVYWIMEVLPLAVTAMLPVIMYPLLGVMDSDDVCRNYLKDTNFLFVGGLIVAVAVEHWNVHRRVALAVLLLMGSKPRWLMMGLMITTGFLSMWISNTATTAMMVPIAHSIAEQVLENNRMQRRLREGKTENGTVVNMDGPGAEKFTPISETSFNGHANQAFDQSVTDLHEEQEVVEEIKKEHADEEPVVEESKEESTEKSRKINYESLTPEEQKLCKGLLLCCAYAANIGGTATLTGTGPNVVFAGVIDDLYPDSGITFASWLLFSLPGTIINLILCWIWLQLLFFGIPCFRKQSAEDMAVALAEEKSGREVIKREYKKLGPWTWGQAAVLCHFVVLALLWLFRNPNFVPGFTGWAGLFPVPDYISDATAAILISILLFIFPAFPPWFMKCGPFKMENDEKPQSRDALLDWKTTQRMLPWNIILLLGGGFALAAGTEASGLSQWLADQFAVLDFLPPWVLVLIITVIICFFTEFTSNVATATIFLPILASLAESICINPLYVMMPATISCSYAFMLPVATPPNAIAFAYGSITVPNMVKAGIVMNIIGIIVVNLLISSMGVAMFDVFTYPSWGSNNVTCLLGPQNVTTVAASTLTPPPTM